MSAPDGAGSRADQSKPPFVIIQPPPNITGALHLGHAQRATVEDAMIRHARMTGRPTLWLPGKDHASIAAQFVLDRILAKEGESRASLGRDRYLERMRRFIDETGNIMKSQHERVGASLDWSRERYTMDEGSALAVRTAFKRLYDDGLAYRTEALVNWCPGCRTSISDLETIATPETARCGRSATTSRTRMAAPTRRLDQRRNDAAGDRSWRHGVAVHPADERYQALIGRTVRIPFVERDVPIIADDVVERAFGTGAVKITPAHDFDDFETGKRHGLPQITVLDDEAKVNEMGGAYAGLDRYQAREAILRDLEARGDVEGSRPHEMTIGRCQRSDDAVEPRLKTQWFVRTAMAARRWPPCARRPRTCRRASRRSLPLAREHPDWNVSRQPGGATASRPGLSGRHGRSDSGRTDACVARGRPAAELTQDPDIFDTRFSSGLWPFDPRLAGADPDLDALPGTSWRPPTRSSSSGSPG
jgi:valyl-tRNA synthetase